MRELPALAPVTFRGRKPLAEALSDAVHEHVATEPRKGRQGLPGALKAWVFFHGEGLDPGGGGGVYFAGCGDADPEQSVQGPQLAGEGGRAEL